MYICVERNVAGVYFKLSTSNGCLHLYIWGATLLGAYIYEVLIIT